MKRYVCIALLVLAAVIGAHAQPGIDIDSLRLARNGNLVQLAFGVNIGTQRMASSQVWVLTPRLVAGADSADFPQLVVMGRNAYYHDKRQGTSHEGIRPDAFKVRYKDAPISEIYARTIEHRPWMDNSTLKLVLSEGTPCGLQAGSTQILPAFTTPPPDTTYVEHRDTTQDELTGSVSGHARIQFIVNRTDFNPNLSNNRAELQTMMDNIMEVRANPDVRITKYRIKGYASPEGSYANNVRLAKGRTERLRDFMVNRWGVPQEQIEVDYEPEDWQGFRTYVVEHRDDYADADAILAIIDSDLDPDARLNVIATRHPASYRRLLADCFPPLRRTDYDIRYEWLRTVKRQGAVRRDTIITRHDISTDDPLLDDVFTLSRPLRPWMALKTNMLFDLALTPNIELEAQLGRDSRWSIMVEDWFPWFLYGKNKAGVNNRYRRPGHSPFRHAYELWVLGAELRYWLTPRCRYSRPTLTGTFIGAYAAGGKYDWERHSEGDQGEFTSLGLTVGHSWVLAPRLNLELSASAGYVSGPRHHYEAEPLFQDNRLIWKYDGRLRYWGPTKLKLSLVWLLTDKPSRLRTAALYQQQKGGRP